MCMLFQGLIWLNDKPLCRESIILELVDQNDQVHRFYITEEVIKILGWETMTKRKFKKLLAALKDKFFIVVDDQIRNLSNYLYSLK